MSEGELEVFLRLAKGETLSHMSNGMSLSVKTAVAALGTGRFTACNLIRCLSAPAACDQSSRTIEGVNGLMLRNKLLFSMTFMLKVSVAGSIKTTRS